MARVHIVGASGAGTTTLGRALAARLGAAHLDTDDFFWRPTDLPFEKIRERAERQVLLGAALAREPACVRSGSLCGWGDLFISHFELVVFLWLAPEIRLARLRERERHVPERCRTLHEPWLAALPCPVVRITDAGGVAEHLKTVVAALRPRTR